MELPNWLLRLEARMGHWGIPHLLRGLVMLNCLTFILQQLSPGFGDSLMLYPPAVLSGEIWRVTTFLFVPAFAPGTFGMLFFLLSMYFLWFVGDGIEEAWGSFLLNFYMLISVVALTAVGLAFYSSAIPSTFIVASLFFAFATLYPDLPIMIFPLPVQIPVKYVAYFSAAFLGFQTLFNPALAPLILASLSGYLLFAGPGTIIKWRMHQDSKRRMKKFRGDDS